MLLDVADQHRRIRTPRAIHGVVQRIFHPALSLAAVARCTVARVFALASDQFRVFDRSRIAAGIGTRIRTRITTRVADGITTDLVGLAGVSATAASRKAETQHQQPNDSAEGIRLSNTHLHCATLPARPCQTRREQLPQKPIRTSPVGSVRIHSSPHPTANILAVPGLTSQSVNSPQFVGRWRTNWPTGRETESHRRRAYPPSPASSWPSRPWQTFSSSAGTARTA